MRETKPSKYTFVCDRCNKRHGPTEDFSLPRDWWKFTISSDYYDDDFGEFDFCEDCMRKFRQNFLKEKVWKGSE